MSKTTQIANDLASIFGDEFDSIIATHINGALNESITGFFDDEYNPVVVGDADVGGGSPTFLIKTIDAGAVNYSSTFTIGGVVYYVIEISPDRSGTKLIKLSKDPR